MSELPDPRATAEDHRQVKGNVLSTVFDPSKGIESEAATKGGTHEYR